MTSRQRSGIFEKTKKVRLSESKMRGRLTGGGGPAAAVLLPSALTKLENMVSDVGRETGGVGMKTGTGFRQPIPRELEGEIAVVMNKLMILETRRRKR
jgi:hypothetical protein